MAMPVPVKKPLPVRKVAPAPLPVRKAPQAAPQPKAPEPKGVTSTETDKLLQRPPLRSRVMEIIAYPQDTLTCDVASKALCQMGVLMTKIRDVEWTAMDGKQTHIGSIDSSEMMTTGFWFSLYKKDGMPEGELTLCVSHIARRHSHSADVLGTLCERRLEMPLSPVGGMPKPVSVPKPVPRMAPVPVRKLPVRV